jgi:hypothetical protein
VQLNTSPAGSGYSTFGNALGTNRGPHQQFNGSPFANVRTGAGFLQKLGKHPERYVGNDDTRKGMLDKLNTSVQKVL